MPKKVAIATLGCKTNQFESAAMIEQFNSAGYQIVPFNQQADIYIVNSCTVTARTDAETRRLVRRARRLNPAARIIATGCYAQVAPEELEKMPELDAVFGNLEKQKIAELADSTLESRISDITAEKDTSELKLSTFAEHTRAFLQIQNGCNSFCSYCIVPFARGRSRSVQPSDVMEGIRNLAANGYKEVVLTGIHLGAYGLDLPTLSTLTSLISQINEERAVPRLRIGSIELNELNEELIQLIASSSIICRHLHLPLQSGSDTVLKRMGRHYSSELFRKLMTRITEYLPDAFIGADVIAGFPGETEEEFQETLNLVNELHFSDLHVFPYSMRPGTKASAMPNHLPPKEISKRASILRDIAADKKHRFLQSAIGTTQLALGQSYDKTGYIQGISRTYIQCRYPGGAEMINQEVEVIIESSDNEKCFAKPL